MIKKCLICNSEFVAKNSFVKKGDGKFCSRKCYGKWRALYFRGNKNSAWRGGKIEQTCKICGKQFLSDRRFILKGYGFLCSKKCRHKWQSKTYRGKNHIKWLGKTSIATQIRATAQYKEWRQNVFIRDRFTCRKCNDNVKRHKNYTFNIITIRKDSLCQSHITLTVDVTGTTFRQNEKRYVYPGAGNCLNSVSFVTAKMKSLFTAGKQ